MCRMCANQRKEHVSSRKIASHPGRFTRGKSMNCLAFRNQSHQSRDRRHEQYPPRDGDKREEVSEALHMNSEPSISVRIQRNY